MKIAREEIFGPVLATLKFKTFDEAVELGNNSMYGLACGIWTTNIKKAHRLAQKIKAGSVWINTYNMYDAAMPYGGYKMSGFGTDSGLKTLDFYTRIKSVWVDLNE
jgi:aldehyde dehydrogenase (NAD+)/phenylacetaldehyde dehydrogenase